METLGDNLVAKSGSKMANKYYCQKCDYTCCKKYNWEKHISTIKHSQVTKGDDIVAKSGNKMANKYYCCENCNKEYSSRNGLWKHSKICNFKKTPQKDEITDKELMMALIKDNSELKNMIMKVLENGTHNTTTNSHNKAFNLQFFLNETCKDAMNIMDFVDSIKLQLSDLERVGEFGFVEGISNIIVKNLKEMDVTQRPVHCTDKKRETLYIKDENKWEKDENKNTMRSVVKKVASKNQRLITKFKEVHPDCNKYSSRFSDQYNKIIVESFDSNYENEEKIIKKVSKEVLVEKEATTI